VIQALEEKLKANYHRTRYHAAWSLGELESKNSLEALKAAIEVEKQKM